ncbi:membrane protein [Bacillus bingmayongensis]|uniref:membrane protein n=1 Tax=Bacillus bingmayongensis TaxID=1150157 RepID=UPI0002FA1BE9|nr:membrane protein [Bacillus bingmayongensis]
MKNNTAKQLVEQNNKLREQLSPENKIYYEDILLYMRTFGFFYEELETERHLMAILQDILEAQKHGESAEEYLGKNPKEVVDQLTKQFDKPSWKSIFKISGLIFLISMFYDIIGSFTTPSLQINGFVILLNGIFSVAFTYGVFKLLHLSIYMKTQLPRLIKFFVVWIIAMVPFGVFILIRLYTSKQGILKIGTPFDWIAILVILIASIIYVISKKKREFFGGLTFVVTLGIFGLLLRIPQMKEFVQDGKNQTFVILSIILPIALYVLVEWLLFRKMEDEN